MTLEQLKSMARNKATGIEFSPINEPETHYYFSPSALDDLIDSTHQATVEEIIKSAEAMFDELDDDLRLANADKLGLWLKAIKK